RRIDPDLPLAALGLDSLAAIELRHELEADLGVSLAAPDLLETASLADLARQVLAGLSAASAPAGGAAAPAQEPAEHPLSWIQQSRWVLQERHPRSTAYHVAVAVRLGCAVEVAPLRAALERLARRHAVLRATFHRRDGIPVQRVEEEARIGFAVVESEVWGKAELEAGLAEEAHRSLDLAAGPVARATLFRGAAGGDLLLLAAHHLVIDGWSLWVLLDELAAVYGALCRGEDPALPPLLFRYADFVRWQEELLAGPAGDEFWRFWCDELAGELPPLELPVDRTRARLPLPPCGRAGFTADGALTRRLREVARGRGATLHALLLAAFQVLLHRYTGQPRFAVGGHAAGRGRPELAGVVGCFFNPLPLVADLAGDPSFLEVLAAAHRRAAAALAHQDYPAHILARRLQAERDGARPSLYDVTFIFQRPQRPAAVAPTADGRGLRFAARGMAMELFPVERRFARSDLELEVTDAGDALIVGLHYRSDLFAAATAERMAAAFEVLLGAVAADPARAVSELSFLTAAEERLLAEWSGERRYPAEGTVHELLAARAARWPERTATAGNGRELSYGELERAAVRLARRLAALDAGGDRLVGLIVDHDHALPVGLLGIWKAGCGFVPLDAAWPRERIALIAEECGLAALVVEGRHLARAAEIVERVASLRHLVCLDALPETGQEATPRPADPDELAYVIYTSGSTGRPKGVALAHRHLVPVLLWGVEALRLGERSRVLQTLSYWFDFGVFEVLTTLLAGGTLVFQDRAGRGEPRRWARQARRDAVNTVHTTPAFWREVTALGEPLPGLEVLHLGGEELTAALVAAARPLVGAGCAIFNGYGPTETAVNSSLFEVDGGAAAGAGAFPIGRASANNRLYVLDRGLRPVPAGAPGELFIGGDGVARGYLARPDLTAERFLPDPFAGEPGARFYRSGDLVRFRSDGNLEFLGRADQQVKVRGFRVELGEVEAALARCPGVREAVVVAAGEGAEERRLVAYLVAPDGAAPPAAELRRRLGAELPEYMVPSAYVTLERLPLNANGKLDRRALPPPQPPAEEEGWAAPRGPVEEMVAGVCAELLERRRIGADENLLDLGCHSL
ncbi:MAG TPA: amino acid adenylation domain-containing protein, partial [Thermoanaerobaculia bacterium]|nr:amino acid adenylation domain-containing protein [Thermoanaerobaculia bacterium]